MKTKLLLLITGFVLAGCSATGPKTVDNWQKYGFEQAINGDILQAQANQTDEEYQLYRQGYEVGKKAYCTQDPYRLGAVGKVYNGICDELSGDFQTQYELGRLEYFAMQAEMED